MPSSHGKYTQSFGPVSTNTTTTLVTPATATQRIYIHWIGIDVTTAGTTSVAKVVDSGGTTIVGQYITTALGHQESFTALDNNIFPGFALPQGTNLTVVTTGGAAATFTMTVVYEVRGA